MHVDAKMTPPSQPVTARPPVRVIAAAEDEQTARRVLDLSKRLGVPPAKPDEDDAAVLRLMVYPDRLELSDGARSRQRPIAVDFLAGATAYRRIAARGQRELIARAVGDRARHLRVIDATAGLARDAFLLAVLGYRVLAIERSAALAAMVDDALARAAGARDEALRDAIARLRIIHADAIDYLGRLAPEERPDAIYLDPMYETSHGTALAKKEMRVLRKLVGDAPDAPQMLVVARSIARKRVVVKRHRHAPPLAEGPSHSILGTSVRYDVYMTGS